MPIANLQWLKTLLSSLNPNELDFFKKRLKLNADRQNRSSKMLQFITQVENDQEIKKTEKNRKMISATEDRLLNHLLDDNCLKKRDNDLLRNIHLSKKFLKAQTLFSEGCTARCIEHLNALLRLPETNLHLFLKEQICSFKLAVLATTGKQEEYLQTLEMKNETEYKRSVEVKAIRIYNQVKLRSNQIRNENTVPLLNSAIDQIKSLKSKHNSDLILFIQYAIESVLLENENKLSQAILKLNQAEKHTKSALINNLIQSSLELKSEKARLFLNQGNYIDSSFYASICNENSPNTTITYYRAKKILFINNFLKENHTSNSWIEGASFKKDLRFKNSDIISWYYLKVCHLRSSNQLDKCLKTIDFITDSFKINSDLNIYLRLHKITLYISLEELDRADKEIESFRKYIQRNKLKKLLNNFGKINLYQFLKEAKASGYQTQANLSLETPKPVNIPISFNYTGYLDLYNFKLWIGEQQHKQISAISSAVI